MRDAPYPRSQLPAQQLPRRVRGSSAANVIVFGTLKAASRAAQCARSSSSVPGPRVTTVATTASPHCGSGARGRRPPRPRGARPARPRPRSARRSPRPRRSCPPCGPRSSSRPSSSSAPRSPVATEPPATVGPLTITSPSGAMRTRCRRAAARRPPAGPRGLRRDLRGGLGHPVGLGDQDAVRAGAALQLGRDGRAAEQGAAERRRLLQAGVEEPEQRRRHRGRRW